MKFQDFEFEYKEEMFVVSANNAPLLFRKISPLIKLKYIAEIGEYIIDSPFIFSDAYFETLKYANNSIDFDKNDVLEWFLSDNDIKTKVIENLMKIKQMYDAPEEIQNKMKGGNAKKKATQKKVVKKSTPKK